MMKLLRTTSIYLKIASFGMLSLLLASSILALSLSFNSTVSADTLNYPWPTDTEAPCEFAPNGGSSCTNPNNSNDLYDWGVYISGAFHQYRNGYEYRNCTDYTQWKESTVNVSVPSNWGNGGQWYSSAPISEQTTTPKAWDAAVVPGNPGHVAFVQSVNTDGTITVSEYNHDAQGHGDTRTATASSMGFTEFVDFGAHPLTTNTVNWSGNFVSTWGVNRLDAFTPEAWSNGTANTDHKWNNGSWQSWDAPLSLSQQISSWPSAVSWGSNRIDMFARDATSSHHLLHAYYDTNGWHNWDSSLGGCITGAPAVSSWGTNRLDIFAQGCGDNGASLNHIWYDGSWHSWETIPITGGQLASAPAAVSWGSGRIDVFAQNYSDNSLIQTYYDTNGWHNWTSLGGHITGAPGVSSWGANRLDVFAQGVGDNGANTNHIYFNGSWQSWETLPNSQQITSSPSAVSWSTNRIDLFARNSSGGLNHRYYDTSGWHDWESLGGTLGN